MAAQLTGTHSSYPLKLIALAIVLTVLVVTGIAHQARHAIAVIAETAQRDLKAQQHFSYIQATTERRDMLAHLTVSTPDDTWRQLYIETDTELQLGVRELLVTATNEDTLALAWEADAINLELHDLTDLAVKFRLKGDEGDAKAIIDGQQFKSLNERYKVSMEALLQLLRKENAHTLKLEHKRTQRIWVIAASGFAAILIIWMIVYRAFSRLRRQFVKLHFAREQADDDLKQLNQQLEGRVEARTIQLKASEQRLQLLSHLDDLTELPNRRAGRQKIEELLLEANKTKSQVNVVVFDIDNFKAVNDTLGHVTGDELLKTVAKRMKTVLRKNEHLFRLGGDEFLVVNQSSVVASDPEFHDLACRVRGVFNDPFMLGEGLIQTSITPSLGVAISPEHGDDVDTLLGCADIAMYSAKKSGRNQFSIFNLSMRRKAVREARLESRLKHALENGELSLHYQPQVSIRTGEVRGVEALLRWRISDDESVPPVEFIPIAERTGQMNKIGDWVIDEAVRQIGKWREACGTDIKVAVNLSSSQLLNPKFPANIRRTLERHQVPASALDLEITESTILQKSDLILETLRQIRAMGVSLSVDDFGTGYSALNHLKSYEFDTLKIDRSFIARMERSATDEKLVKAIISMAESLDMKVVGEGVENLEQSRLLQNLGCDVVQGYYYSPPQPADRCLETIQSLSKLTLLAESA